MPVLYAMRMMALLARAPAFAERINQWLIPDVRETVVNLAVNTEGASVAERAQVRFPSQQLPEITKFLTRDRA